MTKRKKLLSSFIIILTVAVSVLAMVGFVSSAETGDFESSIAAFPESYKPYLRALHEKYPSWTFVPFETELDWNTVIDNEVGTKNLVDHNASSENLKSKESGHYNASTDTYIQKDSGFVVANRLAVEYFMDPRNFLNEEGIFQFEQLTFSDAVTVQDVESVLKGSFMADKFITYYDAEGNLTQTDKKYAEVIYEAGKVNDVNPCYLASKIRNEVGADGSASVSGTHSVYPGIYNFYNIGATDGTGAITRGLQWASEGSTYQRPWNTPEKSIMGGAAYIAEKYVDDGQFTGYLQKFNVNKATGSLYYHQYMTNLSGACSQGYTSYTAYAKTGSLYQPYVFSIPVYNNMPSEDIDTQKASNSDSVIQYGEISVSSSRVRTGPSTDNALLYDQSGNAVLLPTGTSVRIISKTFTDSKYYAKILQYPHWVEIKFTYNSKSYTGYVPEDFVKYTSYTSVGTGAYTLGYFEGSKTNLNLISSNSAIAKVTSENTVDFLKSGTVYLTAYDSVGRYDIVKYVVSDSAVDYPDSIKVSQTADSIKVTSSDVDSAQKYAFAIFDDMGNLINNSSSTGTSVTFKSLSKGTKYTVSARALLSKNGVSVYSGSKILTTYTAPDKVMDFAAEVGDSKTEFTWSKVEPCKGYCLYGYDASSNKYTKISTVSYTKNSVSIANSELIYDEYYIRAYCREDGISTVYGEYSEALTLIEAPAVPKNITVTNIKTNSYTLTWDSVEDADSYKVYLVSGNKTTLLDTVKSNSYTVKDLTPGTEKAYAVAAGREEEYSENSETVYAMTAPAKVSGLKSSEASDTAVTLNWSDAAGAYFYNVYMLTQGEYVMIGQCEDVEYKVENLSELTDYSFKVAAVAKGDHLSQTGALSSELKVTTALSKVQDVSVDNVRGNSVTLSWQENPLAQKYAVYVYSDSKKTYVEKAVTEDAYATVTVSKYNYKYSFAVKAVAEKNGVSIYSDYSDSVGAVTTYPVPENIKVSEVKSASYKLSWNKISDADSYKVYKLKNDSYTLLATVSNNHYTVGNLSFGQIDSYKITAVYKEGSKKVESDYSAEITAATTPAKVKDFKATAYTKTVKLTWSEVENADCYNVYLYEDGKYVLLDTVTGTSYKATELLQGNDYEFYVRAYIRLTGSTVKGSMTSVKATTKPDKVESLNISSVTTTSHTVSWTEAAGANYYYIYRYSSKEKAYVIVAKTDKLSYKFTGLSAGKTYGYRVKSVYMKNGKEVTVGAASSIYKFSTDPAKTSNLKSSDITASTFGINWKKVSGATYYQVAIYSESKGKYVIYGTSDTNSIVLENRKAKTTYKVKVRAVREVADKKYYGAYSSVLSVKTK